MIKKTLPFITFLTIFVLAVIVWYSPILFKGYPAVLTASDGLVRARNFALTGKYAAENQLNVILSPALIEKYAQESMYGNKLGTIIYGYARRVFPQNTNNGVVLFNGLVLALALVFFTLTVFYLFDLKTAVIFALIYIFLPSNWFLPQFLVGYEFALLFLSFFFLFFTLGTKKFTREQEKIKNIKFLPQGVWLILSGIFLVLSALSREAFLIMLPILFIFLVFSKLWKHLIYLFIPIIIIITVAWLPSFMSGQNTYLLFFTSETGESLKSSDYAYYAHIFPDPYTYHFEKDEYIEQQLQTNNLDIMTRLGKEKVLVNMGQIGVSLWQRIKIGTPLFFRHIFRFFSITEIGGPIIFLMFILGIYALNKNSYWKKFYLYWILGSFFLLAYVSLAGRNHMMDFGWPIAICAALGLTALANSLSIILNKNRTLIQALLLLLIIYNLILSGHVLFGLEYDRSSVPLLNAYSKQIKDKNISDEDIIALPFRAENAYNLNFITNKSLVVFQPETIGKLIKNNKLPDIFKEFGVTYILGYNSGLSKQIADLTQVKIIADDTIDIKKENTLINNKNWFMNLIK